MPSPGLRPRLPRRQRACGSACPLPVAAAVRKSPRADLGQLTSPSQFAPVSTAGKLGPDGGYAHATNDGGPSPRVQLQYFPNPASRWTACPVEAVKSCTRRRRTPHHTPTRHEHAACGSLHADLCIRLFASGAPSVRYTTATAKGVDTMTKTTAATPSTAFPSAACAQGEVLSRAVPASPNNACTVSALSDIGIPAGRCVMGRLPSSAASRCAGRATSGDGEAWLILRPPALKCSPSSRMHLRTGCYL